jgi:hypothetical protein
LILGVITQIRIVKERRSQLPAMRETTHASSRLDAVHAWCHAIHLATV